MAVTAAGSTTVPSPSSVYWAEAVRWYGWLIGNFLLIVDIMVAIPTLLLFLRYARLSPMAEAEVRKRLAQMPAEMAPEMDKVRPEPAQRPPEPSPHAPHAHPEDLRDFGTIQSAAVAQADQLPVGWPTAPAGKTSVLKQPLDVFADEV